MRIGVNGLPLMAVHTGIARYLKSIHVLMSAREDVSVRYVTPMRLDVQPPEGATQGGGLDCLLKLPPYAVFALRSAQWLAYEAYLRHVGSAGRIDLVHESFYTPARTRGKVPQVFTLHDLSLVLHAEHHSKDRRLFFDHFFASRLDEADQIIVPSRSVRRELLAYAPVSEERVAVIPEGVDARFSPQSEMAVSNLRREHGLPDAYLLFVGTLDPRKNLSTVLKALARTESRLPLVIIGWSGWGAPQFREELRRMGMEERVVFPGYLTDDELAAAYSGASAFLYPSVYEGFGLPVLEAMACGCPVICSNAASIPEVAGDAAMLVDPMDSASWTDAIDTVVNDPVTWSKMAKGGLRRAAEFSWQRAADRTYDLFKAVIG